MVIYHGRVRKKYSKNHTKKNKSQAIFSAHLGRWHVWFLVSSRHGGFASTQESSENGHRDWPSSCVNHSTRCTPYDRHKWEFWAPYKWPKING